jgi:hypothetical protein
LFEFLVLVNMASDLEGNTPHAAPNVASHNDAVNTSAAGAGTTAAPRASDNASSIDHVYEKEPPVVLTKRQKLKRHFGRFKWWYLAAGIILLIILLPLL